MSMLEEEDFVDADVFITPPGDGHGSDEDSGDEDEGGTHNNLSSGQLRAESVFRMTRRGADGVIITEDSTISDDEEKEDDEGNDNQGEETDTDPADDDDDDEWEVENEIGNPVPKRRKTAAVKRLWRKVDQDQLQRDWPNMQPPLFLSQDLTPTDLFEVFFDDELIDDLVGMTNLYANRDKGDHTFTTSPAEVRAFLTILIISGYSPLPRRTMYWENSKDCHNEAVSELMSRNKFDQLMRYLHMCDNENLPQNDKMGKLRRFYNLVNEKCLQFFVPSQNICVDETMVPYFGRHSSKQFIRGKPVRFGFKMWTLAAASGYIIQFEPYCGAEVNKKAELGLGGAVVMDLVGELPDDLPFKLYIDNFFTGLPLLKALADKGIGATGTIRTNRVDKCPLDGKKIKKAARGEFDYRLDKTESLLVLQWNDNNVVTMASNCDTVFPTKAVKRWSKKDKDIVYVQQPKAICLYNTSMGGVDRADQNVAYYRVSMRTKKWWWPLFAWVIDALIQNAWILYKQSTRYQSTPLDQLAFRRSIVRCYMLRYCSAQRGYGRPIALQTRVPDEVRLDKTGHFSVDIPTQRRCGLCKKNTRKGCSKCPVGLHQACFNAFHGQ